jgi:hypothetical protein
MYRGGGMAVAERILRISTTFRRSIERRGIKAGSPAYRAVSGAMRALPTSNLPGPGDFETAFAPTYAHVRRVIGFNVWLLYRFDDRHLFLLTARGQPPVPVEP